MRTRFPFLTVNSFLLIGSRNMVVTRRQLQSSSSKSLVAASLPSEDAATPPGKRQRKLSTKTTSSSSSTTTTPVKRQCKTSTPSTPITADTPKQPNGLDQSKLLSDHRRLLFDLNTADSPLVLAKLQCRPSKRNKSPYVADILLLPNEHDINKMKNTADTGRSAIVHVPNLDMGGKCIPGATLLVKAARDTKTGQLIGPHAVSPKYGTPKCEFIAQLLHVHETTSNPTNDDDDSNKSTLDTSLYPPTWVGAHPALGERIAEIWLRENLVEWKDNGSGGNRTAAAIQSVQRQVHSPCGADMRSDFLVTTQDGQKRLVEIKTVVDTDYSAAAPPVNREKLKCLFLSKKEPYTRTAIFPWGNSNQKGPDGEKVVSARAIHHIRELTRIAKGELRGENNEEYKATILFVVIRGDAQAFRPNYDACPSFCRYLKEAKEAGVEVIAKRVYWGQGKEQGMCFDDKMLPIEWPEEL